MDLTVVQARVVHEPKLPSIKQPDLTHRVVVHCTLSFCQRLDFYQNLIKYRYALDLVFRSYVPVRIYFNCNIE